MFINEVVTFVGFGFKFSAKPSFDVSGLIVLIKESDIKSTSATNLSNDGNKDAVLGVGLKINNLVLKVFTSHVVKV